jgi:hypothetical protein
MVKQLIITCSLMSLCGMIAAETMQTETPAITAAVLQQLDTGNVKQADALLSDETLQMLSGDERMQLQGSLTDFLMKKTEAKDKATAWGNRLTSTAGILSSTLTVLGIAAAASLMVNVAIGNDREDELEALYETNSRGKRDIPKNKKALAAQLLAEKGAASNRTIFSFCGMAACILANVFITPTILAVAMYKNSKASKLRADKRMIATLLARLQQPGQQA